MKAIINLVTLSPYISTSYHVRELLQALDTLQTSLFQKRRTFIQTIEHEIPFPLSETLKKLAIEHEVDLNDMTDVNQFVTKLREALEQIRRLTITTSIQPTLDLIKEINSWILLNLKQVVVLDFTVDTSIVAGAKIAFNGRLKDYSAKQQIDSLAQMIISH